MPSIADVMTIFIILFIPVFAEDLITPLESFTSSSIVGANPVKSKSIDTMSAELTLYPFIWTIGIMWPSIRRGLYFPLFTCMPPFADSLYSFAIKLRSNVGSHTTLRSVGLYGFCRIIPDSDISSILSTLVEDDLLFCESLDASSLI